MCMYRVYEIPRGSMETRISQSFEQKLNPTLSGNLDIQRWAFFFDTFSQWSSVTIRILAQKIGDFEQEIISLLIANISLFPLTSQFRNIRLCAHNYLGVSS